MNGGQQIWPIIGLTVLLLAIVASVLFALGVFSPRLAPAPPVPLAPTAPPPSKPSSSPPQPVRLEKPSVCYSFQTDKRVPCPAELDQPEFGYYINVEGKALGNVPKHVLSQLGPNKSCVCWSGNRRSPIVDCSTIQLYANPLLFPGCS